MKIIRKIVLCMVICLTLTTSAFAVNSDCVNISVPTAAYKDADDVNAEKVEWIYKTEDGIRYKRLWSLTRGKWLTDWIQCS